jgi:hypothetical protein
VREIDFVQDHDSLVDMVRIVMFLVEISFRIFLYKKFVCDNSSNIEVSALLDRGCESLCRKLKMVSRSRGCRNDNAAPACAYTTDQSAQREAQPRLTVLAFDYGGYVLFASSMQTDAVLI